MTDVSGEGVPAGGSRALPYSVPAAGYWEWDLSSHSVYFSDRLMAVIGVHRERNTLAESEVLDIVHPEDREVYRQALKEHLAGATEVFEVEVRVVDDHGTLHWVINRGVLQRDDGGAPRLMSGSITDVTARRRIADAISLAAGAISGRSGEVFFSALVESLANSLDCDLGFVGRLVEDGRCIRTLGAWRDGRVIDDFTYRLDVSPCRNVVGRETCIYPSGVWERFPEDATLFEGRFQGYAGAPLFDSAGTAIGLLAVLFRAPIGDPELCRNVLSIFALRAAAEIERSEREQALVESERRFRDFAAASADHFWESDEHHRFTRLQGRAGDFFNMPASSILGRKWWQIDGLSPVRDGGWGPQQEVMEARGEFRDVVLRVAAARAGERFVSVSGVPVFDHRQVFRGYRGTATDVTGQLEARRSERETQERLKLAVESADLFVWDWEIGAERTCWRTDPEPLLGPCPAGGYPDFSTMVLAEDRERFLAAYRHSIEDGAPYVAEFRIRGTDGRMRWLSVKGVVVRDSAAKPLRLLGITQDVTARREAEERLRIGASVFATREPIMITDSHGIILDVNEAFLATFGHTREGVIGRSPAILQSGQHDQEFYREFWKRLAEHGYWQGEMLNRARDGRIIPNWMVIDAVYDDNGEIYRYVATCSDISERKQAEERIQQLAWYDPLTRLPNRRMMAALLDETLRDHRRRSRFGGMMFVDIDDFKTVNESLGYRAGDDVLNALAAFLVAEVDGGTVARAGADEFALMLPDLGASRDQAIASIEQRADAVMQRLSRPIDGRGGSFRVSCSIGIHVFPEGGMDAAEFLSQCEIALNRAKTDGHSSARFYHPDMKQRSVERLRIQQLLATMVEDHRIENFYQPQVDIEARMIGVEALARLRADDGTLLEPARFIGVAEETGLIFPLGEQVLRRALADMKAWHQAGSFRPGFVAVNVSPRQFLHDEFTGMVIDALGGAGLDGSVLELEITENLLVEDFDSVIEVMCALKAHGVRFAIDDFGTGYSSLAYLNRLPIDKLKIDRSFVARLDEDETSRAIVNIILSMARAMHLKVVAEGVETADSRQALREWGCVQYQGYLFDRPVPASVLSASRSMA